MRALLSIVLIAGLAWGGWWVVGSTAQKKALESWLAERSAAGWIAEVDDLSITGFPNRFDSTITGLNISNDGNGWDLPKLHIYALSYQPNHIIAAIPRDQTLLLASNKIDISSELFQASTVFKPETSLALDRLQLEIENATLDSKDWSAIIGSANFALQDANTSDPAYKLYAIAKNITTPQAWQDMANLSENIPETHLDATLIFNHPLDRFAIENGYPRLTDLSIHEMYFKWGSIELRASGELTITRSGILEGDLNIEAHDWRSLFQIAKAAGLIPRNQANDWENGLSIVAGLTGMPSTIDANIQFRNGLMFMGFIPLGPAPRF